MNVKQIKPLMRYKNSVYQYNEDNYYKPKDLADFSDIIQYMRTNYEKYAKFHSSIYEYSETDKKCKGKKTDNKNIVYIYINFFLNNKPMTIVYIANVEYYYDTSTRNNLIKTFNNIIPISYSKNAVDNNGNPFSIDKLIEDSIINQISLKNVFNVMGQPVSNPKYALNLNSSKIIDFNPKSEVFIFPAKCFKYIYQDKKDINPLINDFKNTVEEMKGETITNPNIPWVGEYYREAENQWNKHLDETSDKIRGGKTKTKNKKKTKRKINKKRKTKKRN